MKARIKNQQPKMSQQKMLEKIQEMQAESERVQQEVEEAEYTASSGGGAVSATVNGKNEVLKLEIEEDLIDPEEKEMLEDLIIAAVNAAMRDAKNTMEEKMGAVTGDLGNIPGIPQGLI